VAKTLERCLACEAVVNRATDLDNSSGRTALYHPGIKCVSIDLLLLITASQARQRSHGSDRRLGAPLDIARSFWLVNANNFAPIASPWGASPHQRGCADLLILSSRAFQ
jgi:hypothetical protein